MIPRTVLIAACAFERDLSAEKVAKAIARGLEAGGRPVDLCRVEPAGPHPAPAHVSALLAALDFDARMRSARAVVIGARRLHEETLAGSVAFEIATRARQSGVPAYAVTGENALDDFDARILDLQAILEATDARALRKAGRRLAELI